MLLGACGSAGPAAGATTPLPSSGPREQLTIMAVGDSITAGAEYYRPILIDLLAQERCRVDFVGSMMDGDANARDPEHEGHAGYRADELAGELVQWAVAAEPDAVLLFVGINDLLQGQTPTTTALDIETLVSRLHSADPRVRIFIGLLAPLAEHETEVAELNRSLVDLVDQLNRSTRTATVVAVDLSEGFEPGVHLSSDGVHPNPEGSALMARAWFDAYFKTLGDRSCDPLDS